MGTAEKRVTISVQIFDSICSVHKVRGMTHFNEEKKKNVLKNGVLFFPFRFFFLLFSVVNNRLSTVGRVN